LTHIVTPIITNIIPSRVLLVIFSPGNKKLLVIVVNKKVKELQIGPTKERSRFARL